MAERYENPDDPANGVKHQTGKPCIIDGCDKPAGTAWGPFWCWRHNVERIRRISKSLTELARGYDSGELDKLP